MAQIFVKRCPVLLAFSRNTRSRSSRRSQRMAPCHWCFNSYTQSARYGKTRRPFARRLAKSWPIPPIFPKPRPWRMSGKKKTPGTFCFARSRRECAERPRERTSQNSQDSAKPGGPSPSEPRCLPDVVAVGNQLGHVHANRIVRSCLGETAQQAAVSKPAIYEASSISQVRVGKKSQLCYRFFPMLE